MREALPGATVARRRGLSPTDRAVGETPVSALRRTRIRTALRATRAGVLVAALVPALALVAPASAAPRPGLDPGPTTVVTSPATAAGRVAPVTARSQVRLLPTGDRVVVDKAAGHPSYTLVRGPGSSGPVSQLDGGGAHYVVPAAVSGLVGGLLDPSLFEVAAAPVGAGGLTLAIHHAGAAPRLPGVTVTADAAGVATGTLTQGSAPALGAALAREATAVAHGGSTGVFAGVSRIGAAGARTPVIPSFVMHTLVIKGLDDRGAPATSFGLLLNVVDGRRYTAFVSILKGEARVSVPAGAYSGAFSFSRQRADNTFVSQLVPLRETTVSGDGQVLTVDARTATLAARVTTPRPVTGGEVDVTYTRTDALGFAGVSVGTGGSSQGGLSVAPVGAPTRGTQSVSTAFHLVGPAAAAYVYDLSFTSPVVNRSAVQPALPSGRLTTVTERHDTDTDGKATVFGRSAVAPDAFFVFTTLRPIAVPVTLTSYVYASDAVGWSESEFGNTRADDLDILEGFETYLPGTTRTVTWRHAPLAPAVPDPSVTHACLACRSTEGLTLILDAFDDGTKTHSGTLFGSPDGTPVTHFSLTRGTTTLLSADDLLGVANLPAPAAAATYTAVLDVDHYFADPLLSTRTHTEMSFSSAAGAGAPAPPGQQCLGTACRVLPVLQGRALLPTDGFGGVAAGRRTLSVELGRVPGSPLAGITSGTITVRPVGYFAQDYPLVSAGGGRYSAQVDLPSFLVGSKVDVSVSAADAGGSTFKQTVQRAFVITAPTAPIAPVAAVASAGAAGWTSAARPACSAAPAGSVRCFAQWLPGSGAVAPATARGGLPLPTEGYGPANIQAAYGLDPTAGAGRTVAIVGAYDNPNIEADLAVARRTWGLPPCTSASGCFRKVDQRGGQRLPAPDPGWGLETSLDTQAVSAACPRCRILLVEADTSSLKDIGAAVNRAVALGARIVNNSYGTDEFAGMQRYARDFYTHPGVAQVVSSGDFGFTTAAFPAVLPSSVAVGGTTLTHRSGAWAERVWSGAGSGCSAYVTKPAWQHDTHCSMRTIADVSAVADPSTGLAVYDTFGLGASNGWIVVGGTSLSSPLVAGMIGLAGNAPTMDTAARTYAPGASLHDVVGGTNGFCGGDYLCRGVTGYDAPSGNGSPIGVGAL